MKGEGEIREIEGNCGSLDRSEGIMGNRPFQSLRLRLKSSTRGRNNGKSNGRLNIWFWPIYLSQKSTHFLQEI